MYGVNMAAAFMTSQKYCREYSLTETNTTLAQADLTAGLIGLQTIISFTPAGPVLQIISSTFQGLKSLYNCAELGQIKNNPDIDQATKDQFTSACATSSISAVTGLIGGGVNTLNTFGGVSGNPLILSGIGMIDNVGNVVASSMGVQNTCETYGLNSSQCYMALANAGIAVGSTGLSAYNFYSYNKAIKQLQNIIDVRSDQLDQMGVTTLVHQTKSSDPFIMQHPGVDGYYDPKTKTINVLKSKYYDSMTHEQIHAFRDQNGATNNLAQYVFINSNDVLSKIEMFESLEEVGTITENLALYETIDGLPLSLIDGERAYLKITSQEYLNTLKNLQSPPDGVIPPNLTNVDDMEFVSAGNGIDGGWLFFSDGSSAWISPAPPGY
jgi:hypothetical protein